LYASKDIRNYFHFVALDAGLAKIVAEKRLALIKAWEESEKTKAENRQGPILYIYDYLTHIKYNLFMFQELDERCNCHTGHTRSNLLLDYGRKARNHL